MTAIFTLHLPAFDDPHKNAATGHDAVPDEAADLAGAVALFADFGDLEDGCPQVDACTEG
jgi:hypothetical protein